MMNYLKSLITGGPQAKGKNANEKLIEDDISHILNDDDFEEIITSSLDGTATLYELTPLQKPLSSGAWQKKSAV